MGAALGTSANAAIVASARVAELSLVLEESEEDPLSVEDESDDESLVESESDESLAELEVLLELVELECVEDD
jgi:hypothetical protein